MVSNQERLDKCEHTSPMKAGSEGYVGGKEGARKRPFGLDKLVTCNRPGDPCRYGFEQLREQL